MPELDIDLTPLRVVLHPDRRRLAWDQGEQCCAVSGVPLSTPEAAIALSSGAIVSLAVAWLWGVPEIATLWRQEQGSSNRVAGFWTEGTALGGVYRPYDLQTPSKAVCPPEGLYGPALPTAVALRVLALWAVWRVAQTTTLQEAMSLDEGLLWEVARHILCPRRRRIWHTLGQRELPSSSIDHYPLTPSSIRQNWLPTEESTNVGPGIWIPRIVGANGMNIWLKNAPDMLIGIPPRNAIGDYERHPHIPGWLIPLIREALAWFDEEDRSEFLLFGGRVPWNLDEAA